MAPVSDYFLGGSTRLLVRWTDAALKNRMDVLLDAAGVAYGEEVEGGDTEVNLTGAYRRRLSTAFALDLTASGTWFRRDEQPGGERVFDQDLFSADGRLGLAAGSRWVLTAGGRYNRATFPGRAADDDPNETELQDQGNASVAASRELGHSAFLSGELAVRRITSNVETAEYTGPVLVVRSRFGLPWDVAASPLLVYSRRNFDHAANEDSTGLRRDDSWQFGLTLARPLSSRLGCFLEGSYLNQLSNVADFEFDQARISLGFVLQLVSARPEWGPLGRARKEDQAPTVSPEGVRFRIRAPEARTVSVVGGWNGWDPGQDPLQGPDGKGLWTIRVPIPPGIWRYAFVVDGVWTPPPDPPREEADGFGGVQGILEIPGP